MKGRLNLAKQGTNKKSWTVDMKTGQILFSDHFLNPHFCFQFYGSLLGGVKSMERERGFKNSHRHSKM
jgi:hypothetical protein